jgi:hypothetical protein
MNKQDIIKALNEGTHVSVPLFLDSDSHEWQYVALDSYWMKKFLEEYPDDKIFPCELSPFKSHIWFNLPNDIEY